jgi:AraC-like DNA-binding protein
VPFSSHIQTQGSRRKDPRIHAKIQLSLHREWDHPIARKIGVFLRSAGSGEGRLGGRWLISECLHFVDLVAFESTCVMEIARQDYLSIVVQREGEGEVTKGGNTYAIAKGDWAVLSAGSRYRSLSTDTLGLAVVQIPIFGNGLFLSDTCGEASLVSWQTPDGGEMMRQSLKGLLSGERSSIEQTHREVTQALSLLPGFSRVRIRINTRDISLRERIERYLQSNLHDAELNIDMLASTLGCSKRSIHNAFAGEGMSVSQYIWTKRLQRCHAQLAEPETRRISITEIAFKWGFSSPSHFSKLFRTHFHKSPRSFRTEALHRHSRDQAGKSNVFSESGQCFN